MKEDLGKFLIEMDISLATIAATIAQSITSTGFEISAIRSCQLQIAKFYSKNAKKEDLESLNSDGYINAFNQRKFHDRSRKHLDEYLEESSKIKGASYSISFKDGCLVEKK